MNRTRIILLLSVLVAFQVRVARSFEVQTHRALSNKAVLPSNSNLDNFLKTELNFSSGIQSSLFNIVDRSINEWIQEGSEREDDGIRPANHFHDPLRTWGFASPFGLSSIIWGQGTAVSDEFRWQNARQSYFNGLTATTQTEREQNLALTFETLDFFSTQDLI